MLNATTHLSTAPPRTMSGSYDEASLAPEETTDSFWEVSLRCSMGPGYPTASCVETQASSHPQPQPLTLKPLGPLRSPPCSADGGCHEVVPTDHRCPCRDPVEFSVEQGPPDPALGALDQTPSSSQGQVSALQLPGVSQLHPRPHPHTPCAVGRGRGTAANML